MINHSSCAVRPARVCIGDEASQDVGIAGQLEVVDARVVGQAEVEAVHRRPDADRVVRQVLLVEVAVASEELGRACDQLASV